MRHSPSELLQKTVPYAKENVARSWRLAGSAWLLLLAVVAVVVTAVLAFGQRGHGRATAQRLVGGLFGRPSRGEELRPAALAARHASLELGPLGRVVDLAQEAIAVPLVEPEDARRVGDVHADARHDGGRCSEQRAAETALQRCGHGRGGSTMVGVRVADCDCATLRCDHQPSATKPGAAVRAAIKIWI